MPKAPGAVTRRVVEKVEADLRHNQKPLALQLLAPALPEDLAALPHDLTVASVAHADNAIRTKERGQTQVSIDSHSSADGHDYTLITIVNEDRPFLFDSVLGEINDRMHDILLAVHPVLDLTGEYADYQIVDKDSPGMRFAQDQTRHMSVIHVVIGHVDPSATDTLKEGIVNVLNLVRMATDDWKAMIAKLDETIESWRTAVLPAKMADVEEAVAFLQWLRDDNFTMLGMRDYDYTGGEKRGKLVRADTPSLGILANPDIRVLIRAGQPVTTTPEIRAFLNSRELLIVTKANTKSVVHRRSYLDYIGIKRYDEKGKLKGELRIVGLFTSTAYNRSVQRVPYLRSKVDAILKRADFEQDSHSGRALINVLESYPRDELFQIDVPQLARNAEAIIALSDRPKIRVLPRIDPFDRFVSVLVFVPKERYDSQIREQIGQMLASEYDGHVSAFYPAFLEGALTRVHFIIGRRKGKTPTPSPASLELAIADIIRTWTDEFTDMLASANDEVRDGAPHFSFPQSYRETVSTQQAVADASNMLGVTEETPIAVDFYRSASEADHTASLRIYHRDDPVALSRRVPVLENMGFRVIRETTWSIDDARHEGGKVWLHDMDLESRSGQPVPLDEDNGAIFENAFLSVWHGDADNDPYNALVLATGLNCRQVTVLRAIGRYLKQGQVAFSQAYMAATLTRHPQLARHLHELFDLRFNPERAKDGDESQVLARHIHAGIKDMLADVQSIDEDLILRRYLDVLDAMLRTNYYAPHADGSQRATLAFKLDPKAMEFLPQPRPFREIFVYGTDIEGVHLRFGPVARGGLRWSDRAEDYRTEVLGLVKAQQVKNAVIVPVGSKGGFYPKQLPQGGDRQAIFEAGREAYKTFIRSLLSLTDNIVDNTVVRPKNIICLDDEDPYLVVAADKGTATFSDTANGISQDHDFWLDDAFASGGSAGYDHKAMGITARGAWEAVKRHFRDMDKDIQSEPFTVAGVGDMSGDVFGNGMLLSEQIRLIAAFDHRDIFIDPDPDPAVSFAERKRLFEMGRSSWQDYDTKTLSKGGGIFPRNQKTITLSRAAADAIGLEATKATPNEIMTAILKSEVELMWFGGIGTYIRASHESNAEAGDRANDAIRITGKQLRAKVVGEGANLGLTQHARIEYSLSGGRCNSDAIDNSAGVNSSDLEVNIKIALAPSMRDGKLKRPARDKLLEAMTDSVADLVLRNNYEQTLTLSRLAASGVKNLALQAQLMKSLEARGRLDRAVEMLPDDEMIAERAALGIGLTRPEAGVLLSYAKIVLLDDLVNSGLPDDPYLEADLMAYFPPRMRKTYADNIRNHRLRREIIATVLANDVVNRGGPSVISRFEDATGALPQDIVHAHIVTREAYGIEAIHAAIDALDNKVSGDTQMALYEALANAQRIAIGRYLKDGQTKAPLEDAVDNLKTAYEALKTNPASYLPEFLANAIDDRKSDYVGAGLSAAIARDLAALPILATTPEIMSVAGQSNNSVENAAIAYHAVTKAFRLGRLEHLAHQIDVSDYFDGLAQARALDTIEQAHMAITLAALQSAPEDMTDVRDAVQHWTGVHRQRISAVQARINSITDSSDLTVSRLTVAAGLLSDIAS